MSSNSSSNTGEATSAEDRTDTQQNAGYHLHGEFSALESSTIMMVDDEPITMEVIQTFLEEAGYRKFILEEDSSKAMQVLEEQRPDVLLLDLMMPKVSGFEILQQLRESPRFSHLPVIILTSSSDAETKLSALDLGATDFLAKPVDSSELALRVRNTLAAKAYQDQLTYYDRLTNLPNAQLFYDRTGWTIERAKREGRRAAMLYVSFAGFKHLNETLGPAAGDEILKTLAKRLQGFVRSSDALTRHQDKDRTLGDVYRAGGAEFSVLLPSLNGNYELSIIGQRLLAAVKKPIHLEDNEIELEPKVSAAVYPDDALDSQQLLKCALSANAQAHLIGGDRLHFYSAEMNEAAMRRIQMETELRNALSNNELRLLYQPKVDVQSGRIIGAEALIRWFKGSQTISPDEFIPIAESTGLILPIGEWVIEQACAQIKTWHDADLKLKVAVNVSARQLFETDLVRIVESAIRSTGINPNALTLEMTENLLIEDVLVAVEKMAELRTLGVSISMDDFGTGYSSLSYLKKFPLDEVKIDRAFIMDAVDSKEDKALVSAIVYLAHEFGFNVCAEGVEQQDQLAFLQEAKCDVFQGYLCSRPVEVEAFNQLAAQINS